MAITNYTELKTAVGNWLARGDLTTRIPEFITLGEAYLNREIKGEAMIDQATVTTSIVDRFAALPTGMLEIKSLANQYGDKLILSNSGNVAAIAVDASSGMPEYYAITDQFEFDRVSDQAYSLTCTYRKKLDIATDSTNWLLTKWPDAYLYASLMQAMPYIRNEARMASVKIMLDEAISSINRLHHRPLLRVDSALISGGGFDIVSGQ